MTREQKLLERQRKDAFLQAQYSGLVNLHVAALINNDKQQEGELRNQIHSCIDAILDASAETVRIMLSSHESE